MVVAALNMENVSAAKVGVEVFLANAATVMGGAVPLRLRCLSVAIVVAGLLHSVFVGALLLLGRLFLLLFGLAISVGLSLFILLLVITLLLLLTFGFILLRFLLLLVF